MQYARGVHVIELETLHLRAVDERRVRRRKLLRCPPYDARRCPVELPEAALQDAAPFEIRAVDAAPQGIEGDEFQARYDLGREILVTQTRYELRNTPRVRIVGNG